MGWDDFQVWVSRALMVGAVVVLYYTIRGGVTKIDALVQQLGEMNENWGREIANIRERLGRLEGHLWPTSRRRDD